MKLVLFTLGLQDYGVDIEQVGEVIRLEQTVPLPDVPPWVAGLISLHGEVMLVINLRKKLHLADDENNVVHRVMIVRCHDHVFGVIVDSVLGVVDIETRDITIRDDIVNQTPYISGVARISDHLVPLMDLYTVLGDKDIECVRRDHADHLPNGPVADGPVYDNMDSITTGNNIQSMEAQ